MSLLMKAMLPVWMVMPELAATRRGMFEAKLLWLERTAKVRMPCAFRETLKPMESM